MLTPIILHSRMKVLYILGVERDEDVGLLPGRPQRSWASTKYSKNMSLKKAIEGGGATSKSTETL